MTRRAVRCLGAALAPLLTSACVTERIIERPAAPPCDPATGANCPPPPRQLSPREQEELVLEDECGRNTMESCVELGRLLMEDGNLPRAEIPLRKAYRDDNAAAAVALAELYDRRGEPVRAEEMRWAAPAIDKANSETAVWYRPGTPQGGRSFGFAVNLQPMVFWARRFDLGFEMAFYPLTPSTNVSEVNGFFGYQHYFSEYVVGYGHALLGDMPQVNNGALNYGAELGVKLELANYVGLNLGFGASRASAFHLNLGITFNSIAWIIPVLLLGSR